MNSIAAEREANKQTAVELGQTPSVADDFSPSPNQKVVVPITILQQCVCSQEAPYYASLVFEHSQRKA